MKGREKDRPKPTLAKANQPFTPMTRKAPWQVDTPFQALHVDDLGTPKVNRSDSFSDDHVPDDLPPPPPPPPSEMDDDVQRLKRLLLQALERIERLEHKHAAPSHRTVATQTRDGTAQRRRDAKDQPNDSDAHKIRRPQPEDKPRRPLAHVARNVPDGSDGKESRQGSADDPMKESETQEQLTRRLHDMELKVHRLRDQRNAIEHS
jgi:hypothetical protein